jgi:hypothetical protein
MNCPKCGQAMKPQTREGVALVDFLNSGPIAVTMNCCDGCKEIEIVKIRRRNVHEADSSFSAQDKG